MRDTMTEEMTEWTDKFNRAIIMTATETETEMQERQINIAPRDSFMTMQIHE